MKASKYVLHSTGTQQQSQATEVLVDENLVEEIELEKKTHSVT